MPSPRVALATSAELPDLDDDSRLLPPALARAGISPVCLVWDDPTAPWDEMDLVLVRSTWDYWDGAGRREAFVAWAERVGAKVPLWNRPEVIRWNTDKSYLRALEGRGVPVVPTLWLGAAERAADVVERGVAQGFSEVVIKPAVSAGSEGALRIDLGRDPSGAVAHAEALASRGCVMVQPFLGSIATEGELSIIFFDGEASHAVRKVPRSGDYRSQPEFGSAITRAEVTDEARAVAESVLTNAGGPFLYARVDLVRGLDGALCLIELEVTEPCLYLGWGEGSADRFGRVIAGRIRG
jgi:glutathione synthase/RimK-type ligase-like ATP-grasp enzyme